MTCKCGYQNHSDAKYCARCGRKLRSGEGIRKKVMALVAVCLLITGIGIGNMLPSFGSSAGESGQNKGLGDILAKNAEITQVLPVDDGSIASLYIDGTVRVSENSPFWGKVSDWKNVEKLYYNKTYEWNRGGSLEFPVLFGLTKDGSVLSTDGSLSGWSNVKEMHFDWQGIVGVTYDGKVLADGDWEDSSFLTDLIDVEHLVFGDYQDIWGCLGKNGNVTIHGNGVDPNKVRWSDVKELRSSGHAFYVIKNNGTVDGGVEDDQSGLNGAAKIVDFEDWLFGIADDGKLLTYNGGNICLNAGALAVEEPDSRDYGGEVDIHQFDQVKDIVPFGGLVLLNKDGTVQFLGAYPEWDFSGWQDIQRVYATEDKEGIVRSVYGIRKDGSVLVNQYDGSTGRYTAKDQYCGWKLQELYCVNGGVIGLTTEGKLVGDGIYANVDFSVFDR